MVEGLTKVGGSSRNGNETAKSSNRRVEAIAESLITRAFRVGGVLVSHGCDWVAPNRAAGHLTKIQHAHPGLRPGLSVP